MLYAIAMGQIKMVSSLTKVFDTVDTYSNQDAKMHD